ncbi:unnamed protein product [Linum tenue]|uniref:Uncharacterized protein n=1 Tax=Linum tenue TaxID=586396 RepID=A0AAV0LX49_9ROSI|nr:unnamed protein product [Linum tenue]
MVRPSTRTPEHLRNHSLSFFDQMAPPFYVPLLYLYPNHDDNNNNIAPLLKLSLSKALSTYYPLAGSTGQGLHDPLTVRCNDEGALFLQARMMSSPLASIVDDEARLRLLFPDDLAFRSTTALSTPLVVQITSFECGGMALAVCASHKVLDMSSFCSFVNHWASSTAAGDRIEQVPVRFDLAALFPPVDVEVTKTFDPPNVETVCRRFAFGGSSIGKLKAMMRRHGIENPTRVEAVLALVCSSAISAADSSSRSRPGSAFLTQAVNLRPRLTSPPSITTSSIGNLSSIFAMLIEAGAEMDLVSFVSTIRRVKTEYFETCSAEYSRGEDFRSFIVESTKVFRDAGSSEEVAAAEPRVYISSSWCNFPVYEADFGWGKPVRVTTAAQELKDTIVLLDTKDGDGVEALVCLEEREMAAFQCDKMVLAFADINNQGS